MTGRMSRGADSPATPRPGGPRGADTPPTKLNGVTATLLAMTGMVHLWLVPAHLAEEPLLGAAFLAGGIASVAAALRLWRQPSPAAWLAAAGVAATMGVAYLASRTVGLVGIHERWGESPGLATLAGGTELAAIAVALTVAATARR